MEWLRKWNLCNQQEKVQLWKDQELLMGDVLNLQASIGIISRDEGGKYQVGTIWEGIRLSKHIIRQVLTISLQAKEEMDKVNARALKETATIKDKLQSTIALVKNKDQGQRRRIKSIKSEVESLNRRMIEAPCLEQWSKDMNSVINPVLELLVDPMKHFDINVSTGGGGVVVGMPELAELKGKWEGHLNEDAARIDGMAMFAGGR